MRAALLWLAVWALPAGAQPGRASVAELSSQVDQIAGQLKVAEDNLKVVETQYTERPEPTDEESRLRRFSDGEIQYLLEDWRGASVLFYDLVSDQQFRSHPKYPDALFYLSDALYQQKNYVGSKLYLKELLALKSRHYRQALVRYLELAGRLNEFAGIDEFIEQARGVSGGTLPPEIAYVYGKWLFKREDLAPQERTQRAIETFKQVADARSAYAIQSAYFVGVGLVRLRDFEGAIAQFQRVLTLPAQNARERQVKELASLSLGRVLYETEKYDQALDRYQEVGRESEYFVDSLYEVAWTQVKKNEFERAKNATDIILLMVGDDDPLKPEAQILQGHLLLKLRRFGDATDAYNLVINKYGPVRDEVQARLDQWMARSERSFELADIALPPVAEKWANTQQEVADAKQMLSDLEAGKAGVNDSEDVAQRILRALEERGMETFPALQEGYLRADAVDSALTQATHGLVQLEGYLLKDHLSDDEKAAFERLKTEQQDLKNRFETLPTNDREVASRRKKMQERVDDVDKQAFKLGYEIQAMTASLTAIEKWIDDTKTQRRDAPEDEKAFIEKVKHERDSLAALQRDLDELRQELAEQRTTADAVVGGEDLIRKQYDEAIARQHAALAGAEGRAPTDVVQVVRRAHELRSQSEAIRVRVAAAKQKIHDQVARRGRQIRETVLAEQQLLLGYGKEVKSISHEASSVLSGIVENSYRRVKRQFHDLVLKADVGIVDAAFTRKQDKTSQIQKLASQKDRELRALDEEFKEVLKEVD